MIRTVAAKNGQKLVEGIPLERLREANMQWIWVDIEAPSEEEAMLLKTHFQFHPLAIEDCLHLLQRPKLDQYDGYDFFVLHSIDKAAIAPLELDVFLGHNFIVTFHFSHLNEIDAIRQRVLRDESVVTKGAMYIFYLILDKIVDEYFPIVYQIEDEINDIENKTQDRNFIEEVFDLRSRLFKLRRSVVPMQELLYRTLNAERVVIPKEERAYFMDIYDHLLKLSEMIESNREITADLRDSYISLNSNRMNSIMKTLTVITSIFIPLTFIAGIYGMNFEYMPELTWRWGYFAVLGVMFSAGMGMFLWFWRKGWFK